MAEDVFADADFNPRPHAGDDGIYSIRRVLREISIHVPTRGTTMFVFPRVVNFIFQSTSPRGGRHPNLLLLFPASFISIHVPTRGTTNSSISDFNSAFISIHVPTRGTTAVGSAQTQGIVFQSTSPRGGRHGDVVDTIVKYRISIHVPTRGTTQASVQRPNVSNISIHVPTRGTTQLSLFFFIA